MQQNNSIEAEIKSLRFYLTSSHECNYISNQTAVSLFVDPQYKISNTLYGYLSAIGFRRSGEHVYRPHCPDCRACLSLRVPVDKFKPDRSQRRLLKSNNHLTLQVRPAGFDEDHYRLYRKYMSWRHPGGGMDSDDPDAYHNLYSSSWSDTEMLCFYNDDRLNAVAITDILERGVSAVYTFYDPDLSHQGLGTYAILRQIEYAREKQLPYVYLGYWVEACTKMAYKARFSPHQTFRGTHWQNSPQKP